MGFYKILFTNTNVVSQLLGGKGIVEPFCKWGADNCRSYDEKCLLICRSNLNASYWIFQSNSYYIKHYIEHSTQFPLLLLLLGMLRTLQIGSLNLKEHNEEVLIT